MPFYAAVRDLYTDATRPYGTRHDFHTGPAQWNPADRMWYPMVPIAPQTGQHVVHQATPLGSPSAPTTTPINPVYLNPQTSATPHVGLPAPWPPLTPVAVPNASLTAKQSLEMPLPVLARDGRTRATGTTQSRNTYPSLRKIYPLQWPNDLTGYSRLSSTALKFNYVDEDPTLWLDVEADAIWACKHYVVSPVNTVLQTGVYFHIRTASENTKSVQIQAGPTAEDVEHHLSRLDLMWDVHINGNWNTFAVLEFKRPGALKNQEWSSALLGQGPVTGTGEKICRQVIKYAYNRDTPFVAAYDWETLILLRLRGLKPSCHGEQAYAPGIEADGAWLTRKGDFKRALFVWLRMALEAILQRFDKNLYSQS
jgi:hypothetical protein